MKLRILSNGFALLAILGAVSVPSGAATAVSPYAEMKSTFADANAEQTLRYTITATLPGKRLVNVTDATHLGGRQTITLTEAGQSNTVIVELIAGNAYVKGDAAILNSYMGFPKANAKRLANHWLEIPPSNPNFAGVSAGITIASALMEVTMTTSVTATSPITLNGKRVGVLKGKSVSSSSNPSADETLYITMSNKPLPVEAMETYQGTDATIDFGHWNETVVLATPKSVLLQK